MDLHPLIKISDNIDIRNFYQRVLEKCKQKQREFLREMKSMMMKDSMAIMLLFCYTKSPKFYRNKLSNLSSKPDKGVKMIAILFHS